MNKTIKKAWSLFNKNQRKKTLILSALIILNIFVEALGVGIILPVITAILDPEKLLNYEIVKNSISYFIEKGWFFGQSSVKNLNSSHVVIFGMILMLIIFTLRAFYLSFITWWTLNFEKDIRLNFSNKLFNGYLLKPYTFHLQKNSANLIRNIEYEVTVFTRSISATINIVTEIMVLLGIFAILVIFRPFITFSAIFILSSLYGLYFLFSKKRLTKMGYERVYHSHNIFKHLHQSFGSIKEVKLLGREKNFYDQFKLHNTELDQLNIKKQLLSLLPRFWVELLLVIFFILIIFYQLYLNEPLYETLPTIGLFFAAAFRIMPSFNKILNNAQELRFAKASINITHDEIKSLNEDELNSSPSFHRNKSELSWKHINLENVYYEYQSGNKKVLENINLKIPRGSSIGFVGTTGSGKSTLIDITLGLLTASQGKVLIDGNEINKNMRSWQSQIGYVPQNIYLSDDTLRRNIALGLSEDKINNSAVEQAIKAAELYNFVSSLPEGYNTKVGERGVRLSGGQRQRIGIARALYHNPTLLVLDEATNSLDTETEKNIMKTIYSKKGSITVLIVAHRTDTLAECDKIYRIEKGKIIS